MRTCLPKPFFGRILLKWKWIALSTVTVLCLLYPSVWYCITYYRSCLVLSEKFTASPYTQKPYLLTKFRGRIGNQLFIAAMIISVARRNGYVPLFQKYLSIWNIFEFEPSGSCIWSEHIGTIHHLYEKRYAEYDSAVDDLDGKFNLKMWGFFQSFKYHDTAFLKSVFKFLPSVIEPVEQFLRSYNVAKLVTIGVHVRRGDLLTAKLGHRETPVEYLSKAMTYYRKQFSGKKVLFVIVSDDIEWCKLNIRSMNDDTVFSQFRDPGSDMALMSLCDHSLITQGSFSWWCAWFCGGKVVYWKGFPPPGTIYSNGMNRTHYYPEDWIGIE